MVLQQPVVTVKLRTAVIICAYSDERWPDLVAAVASVRHQTLPADELIVVIDHIPALLACARECFAGAIVVENPGAQGLSNARNAGIAAATADLLAFLDDDAVAHPDWLSSLVAAMAAPGVIGTGG